jgi:hypothetical protein
MNTPSYDLAHVLFTHLTEETREVAKRILGRVQAVQKHFLQPEDPTPEEEETRPSHNTANSFLGEVR